MKNNLQYRKSIRVHKRKSTPLDRYIEHQAVKQPQEQLDRVVFEQASFQAVYRKITKQMHINVLPDRRVVRDRRPGEESKRIDTQHQEENKERRIYYSVERSRDRCLKIVNQLELKPTGPNRSSQSATQSLHRMRRSDNTQGKLTQPKIQQPLRELVLVNAQISQDFPHFRQIINHFVLFQDILTKLKHAETGVSIIESVRSYILEGADCDVSQLPLLFTAEENRQMTRTFLFLERVSVLIVIEELLRKKLKFEYSHVKSLLSLISDTYVEIFTAIQRVEPEFATKEMLDLMRPHIPKKNAIIQPFYRNNESIIRRISNLLRYSRGLLDFIEASLHGLQHLSVNMSFYRLLQFFALHLVEMHINEHPNYTIAFLSTCPSPYLHKPPSKPYTLVLDLDQTLVHYNSKNSLGQFKIRPYCQEFIFEMSEYFEIGIFTCGMPDYADWVVSHLKGIEFKLYRHHAIQTNTGFIKDLSRLGRDLKRVIMIDNLSHNFQLQKQNGIELKGWFGDPHDVALVDVMKVLKYIANQKPDDIRVGLRQFGEKAVVAQSQEVVKQ